MQSVPSAIPQPFAVSYSKFEICKNCWADCLDWMRMTSYTAELNAGPSSSSLTGFVSFLLLSTAIQLFLCAMSFAALSAFPFFILLFLSLLFNHLFFLFPFLFTLLYVQHPWYSVIYTHCSQKSVKPQRYVVEETSYYVTSFYLCQEAGCLGCRRISCAACPCLFNLNLAGRALLTGAI